MNNFIKHWLTSSCAPESVTRDEFIPKGTRMAVGVTGKDTWITEITNETKTDKVKVVSLDNAVIGICYKGKWAVNPMSFSDACLWIAKCFNLNTITSLN